MESTISSIRAQEDRLFREWSTSGVKRYPFAVDGCPDPVAFANSDRRMVFVLKERNWGYTSAKLREMKRPSDQEILREISEDPGRNDFKSWWITMAKWAAVLSSGDRVPWEDIERDWDWHARPKDTPIAELPFESWVQQKCNQAFAGYALMQLSKTPGGGELNDAFSAIVEQDQSFIRRQFAIYDPHFVISCGSSDNWRLLTQCVFPETLSLGRTLNGIDYLVAAAPNEGLTKVVVVNFAHPSMRVNGRLWGVLAHGLRDAIEELHQVHFA